MAIRIHELPTHKFAPELRGAIARLNRELRDISGLEGTLDTPPSYKRSDSSVARRGGLRVHIDRISPDLYDVIAGTSTRFADPTASVGLAVVAGTTKSAMRADAAPPLDQSIEPNWTGTHAFGNSMYPTDTADGNSWTIGVADDNGFGALLILPNQDSWIGINNNDAANLVAQLDITYANSPQLAFRANATNYTSFESSAGGVCNFAITTTGTPSFAFTAPMTVGGLVQHMRSVESGKDVSITSNRQAVVVGDLEVDSGATLIIASDGVVAVI